jgi:hypothetical protein
MIRVFIFLTTLLLLKTGHSQEYNRLVYCLGNDSIVINKIDQYSNGDTTVYTFSEDFGNTLYSTYKVNDTLYTTYNGQDYFIGTNIANVGDEWHPLRFQFMSFEDSSISCNNLMNLEVVQVGNVNFDGQILNSYVLEDLDLQFNVMYNYIENLGVIGGGPFYNLTQQFNCDVFVDFPQPEPRYFHNTSDTLTYISDCSDETSLMEIDEEISILIDKDKIVVDYKDVQRLFLYGSAGKQIASSSSSTIQFTNLTKGTYFLKIQTTHKTISKTIFL